jgi:hypothetical protein
MVAEKAGTMAVTMVGSTAASKADLLAAAMVD